MCNNCNQTRCCCDSPTRYGGPNVDCVGLTTGTPYDAVIQQLAEFLCDIEFEDGQGIDHVSFTSSTGTGAGEAGQTDTYTVWGDIDETIDLGTFEVYNGANGVDGINGNFIQVTSEPAGVNCANGGILVEVIDGSDGVTVLSSSYVCNGVDGADGAPGADGSNGDYVVQTVEPAGVNCANGGTKVEVFDGNTDVLLTTTYVCNGIDGVGGGGGAFGGLTLRIVDGLGDPEQLQGNLLGYLDTPYDPDLGRQTLIPNSIYYFKNIPSTADKTLWIRLPFDGTYNGGVTPQRGDKIIVQADDQEFFDSDSYVAAGTEFLIGTQIPPLNSDPQIEVYIGRQGDPNGNPGVTLENINSSYANPLDASRARYLIINRGTDHFNASSVVFNWMRWEFECIEDFSNDGRVIWQIVNTTVYSVFENVYAALDSTYYE